MQTLVKACFSCKKKTATCSCKRQGALSGLNPTASSYLDFLELGKTMANEEEKNTPVIPATLNKPIKKDQSYELESLISDDQFIPIEKLITKIFLYVFFAYLAGTILLNYFL